jgi:tetratricopeptide (TPR) repeat protein
MIRFVVLMFALLSAVGARAAQDDPRLDRLFLQLNQARTGPEITALTAQIGGIWNASGSETIDLLMARASEASEKGAPDVALDLLDRVVTLAPRYAEAWRRRGAVQLDEGNGEDALGDLREALKLEPRHFGALNDIVRILEESGDASGAMEAMRRLANIIPHAEGMRQRLLRLEEAARSRPAPI